MGYSRLRTACRLLVILGLLLAGGMASIAWRCMVGTASIAGNQAAATADWPSAEALLHGVAGARKRCQSIHVELTSDDPSAGPHRVTLIADTADQDELRRFERLADDNSPGEVAILDHGELRWFRRVNYEDVCLDDAKTAIGRYESLVFDPRLLGLTSTFSADGSLEDHLCYNTAQPPVVLGKEELNGAVVWRVQAASDSVVSTFWIEPSTFRVHKRLDTWQDGCCEIWSYFDDDKTGPLPSRVHVLMVQPQQEIAQATFAVGNLVLNEKVPAERFSLSSMDLPINTAIVDYRIHRRIGYWNGQAVQEKPTPIEHPAMETVLAPFYGKAPPELAITDARGVPKDVKLADFRGKWVLLDFWCTSCGSCVDELSQLAKFYEEHAADRDRFEILAIASEGDAIRTMQDFDGLAAPIVAKDWGGKGLPFPILLDADEKTFSAYGIQGLCCLLIDPEGNLVKDGDQRTLAEKLKASK